MEDKENLSLVLYGINDMRLENRSVPKPGKNEVLISMHSVGICGSDVHYLKAGRIGDFIVKEPMVLGHEASGIIVELGEGVTGFEKGDRVALEPGVPCRKCDLCKQGRYNLCPDIEFAATPPVHGSLCRYFVHPADFCFKLPDHVSCEEGALFEPLSVGVHACRRAGVSMGDKVLILGSGPIGLVNLLVAKACGASSVAITDLDDNRLNMAKKMGADQTFKIESRDSKVISAMIKEKFGWADKTIECSGVELSIQTGIYVCSSFFFWSIFSWFFLCCSCYLKCQSVFISNHEKRKACKRVGISCEKRKPMKILLEINIPFSKTPFSNRSPHVTSKYDSTSLLNNENRKYGKFQINEECGNIVYFIGCTKSGGVLVIVGMGKEEVTLPMVNALCREVDIRGIFRYANTYPTALDLVSSGKVNVKPLITHRFKLEESHAAFEASGTGSQNAVKVMINCQKE